MATDADPETWGPTHRNPVGASGRRARTRLRKREARDLTTTEQLGEDTGTVPAEAFSAVDDLYWRTGGTGVENKDADVFTDVYSENGRTSSRDPVDTFG